MWKDSCVFPNGDGKVKTWNTHFSSPCSAHLYCGYSSCIGTHLCSAGPLCCMRSLEWFCEMGQICQFLCSPPLFLTPRHRNISLKFCAQLCYLKMASSLRLPDLLGPAPSVQTCGATSSPFEALCGLAWTLPVALGRWP